MAYRNIVVVAMLAGASGAALGATVLGGESAEAPPSAESPRPRIPTRHFEALANIRAGAGGTIELVSKNDGVAGSCRLRQTKAPADLPADCKLTWALPRGSVSAQGEVRLSGSNSSSRLEAIGRRGSYVGATGTLEFAPRAEHTVRLVLDLRL